MAEQLFTARGACGLAVNAQAAPQGDTQESGGELAAAIWEMIKDIAAEMGGIDQLREALHDLKRARTGQAVNTARQYVPYSGPSAAPVAARTGGGGGSAEYVPYKAPAGL